MQDTCELLDSIKNIQRSKKLISNNKYHNGNNKEDKVGYDFLLTNLVFDWIVV